MSAADLERWEARWRQRGEPSGSPEPYLVRNLQALRAGSILDVACGDGRNALWLARQGHAVTALDIAPAAIARLRHAAEAAALTLATRVADLDAADALAGLGPFANLVVLRFKPDATQWPRLLACLSPGGRLLLCSFGPEQHRRHGFPQAFCLERDELRRQLEPALALVRWDSFEEAGAWLEGSLWRKDVDGEDRQALT